MKREAQSSVEPLREVFSDSSRNLNLYIRSIEKPFQRNMSFKCMYESSINVAIINKSTHLMTFSSTVLQFFGTAETVLQGAARWCFYPLSHVVSKKKLSFDITILRARYN